MNNRCVLLLSPRPAEPPLNLLDDLDNILVGQVVFSAHFLRLVLHGHSPNPGVLELSHQTTVDSVGELRDCWSLRVQNNRSGVIRNLPLGLRVNTNHHGVGPDAFQQLVEIPLLAATQRNDVRQLDQQFQLNEQQLEKRVPGTNNEHTYFFERNGIDLVQNVQSGHVNALDFGQSVLNHINEIVHSRVDAEREVSTANTVLLEITAQRSA